MISLKFLEIKLKVKNAVIENVGILGIFILNAFKDGLSIDDISDITKFKKSLLNEKIEELKRRGYLNNNKINERGLHIIEIYQFLKDINNSSIIIDLYIDKLYWIKKDFLEENNRFLIYPQKLFDYGILKKINNNKKEILEKFNKKGLRIYYDNFELSYNVKKVYYANFQDISLGGQDFKIGEKVLKISYNIQSFKYENYIKKYFKNFYFSLYSKEKYENIKEYKGNVFLPSFYSINDIECDKEEKIDLSKLCLSSISISIKEKVNERFIDIEKMIRNISESS